MNLLSGTPYELDEKQASRVVQSMEKLDSHVQLLRKRGDLDEHILKRLRDDWGFRQVHESAAIEGNRLTLNETQIAIERGVTISGKPPEHSTEVQNLHQAILYAEQLAKNVSPLTKMELCNLQRLIVGPEHADSGAYREGINVAITNSRHQPPHWLKARDDMEDFFRWMADSTNTPVLLLCSVTHAWLTHIHPFSDGNGRTARAVSNLQLSRSGYPIIIIRRNDRERYYEALRASDEGDITPFLELNVDRCEESLRQINRIRIDVSGLGLAIQDVSEADQRKYDIWASGVHLFLSTFEELLKSLEETRACQVRFQRYDMPTAEDYLSMTMRNPEGNSWLLKATIEQGNHVNSLLLWIGLSSDRLMTALKTDHPIPVIKISQPNNAPPPQWTEPDETFPSSAREFAYSKGEFFRNSQVGASSIVTHDDNVQALCLRFVEELASVRLISD